MDDWDSLSDIDRKKKLTNLVEDLLNYITIYKLNLPHLPQLFRRFFPLDQCLFNYSLGCIVLEAMDQLDDNIEELYNALKERLSNRTALRHFFKRLKEKIFENGGILINFLRFLAVSIRMGLNVMTHNEFDRCHELVIREIVFALRADLMKILEVVGGWQSFMSWTFRFIDDPRDLPLYVRFNSGTPDYYF